MSRNQFRLLVAAGWAFSLLGCAVMEFEKHSLPAEVQAYLKSAADAELSTGTVLRTLLLFAAFLAASLGLLWFKHWARTLYVISFALGLLALPALPPTVVTPWASLLSALSWLAVSSTMVLMYLPPVKEYFNRKKSDFS